MAVLHESQTAGLVSEGRVTNFYEPGMYRLETRNLPVLTMLESWLHSFSPVFSPKRGGKSLDRDGMNIPPGASPV